MGSSPLRLVLVDDQRLIREGLQSLLETYEEFRVVGTAGTMVGAVATVAGVEPDVVLLELRMGAASGIDLIRRLRADHDSVTLVVLTAADDPVDLQAAFAAGANGYISKSVSGEALVASLRRAHAGETVISDDFVPRLLDHLRTGSTAPTLTAREEQVLARVQRGLSNAELAEALEVSVRTAQKHVENLFKKFAVHNRAGLREEAHRFGYTVDEH